MSDWKPAHAPTFDTRESLSAPRGDRVLIFSDFDRAEPHFFRMSNLVDFHYFSIFFDHFRYFSIVYTPESVQKRLELFAVKIRGRMGVERAVLMCATRQYLSLPGGTLGTKVDERGTRQLGHRWSTDFDKNPTNPGSQISMSRSVRSGLELSEHSGPCIEGVASQNAQNITSLGL